MSSEAWGWRIGLPRPLRLLLVLLTLSGLLGCKVASPAIDSFCLIAKPIHDSSRDTPETRQQVLEHNARWACICEHDCPPAGG